MLLNNVQELKPKMQERLLFALDVLIKLIVQLENKNKSNQI